MLSISVIIFYIVIMKLNKNHGQLQSISVVQILSCEPQSIKNFFMTESHRCIAHLQLMHYSGFQHLKHLSLYSSIQPTYSQNSSKLYFIATMLVFHSCYAKHFDLGI